MTDDDLLDMLADAADGLSPGKEGWQPYRDRLERIIAERNTFRDDAIPQAAQIMNDLTVERDEMRDRWAHAVIERDAAEAERDRLRAQNNERAGILLHLGSVLGDAPVRVERDMPDAVAEIVAERDRLRAIVEDAVDMLSRQDADYDEWTALLGRLTAALDAKEGT